MIYGFKVPYSREKFPPLDEIFEVSWSLILVRWVKVSLIIYIWCLGVSSLYCKSIKLFLILYGSMLLIKYESDSGFGSWSSFCFYIDSIFLSRIWLCRLQSFASLSVVISELVLYFCTFSNFYFRSLIASTGLFFLKASNLGLIALFC